MTYNGWTNWETWTASMIFYDSDYLFHRGREDAEDGRHMDLRQFEEYLETDFFDNYEMYASEVEGTGFYNLFETYTRSALHEIDFKDLADSLYDGYQDGRKSYLKEIEEEEEE